MFLIFIKTEENSILVKRDLCLGHVSKPVFDGMRPSGYLAVGYELSISQITDNPLYLSVFSARI